MSTQGWAQVAVFLAVLTALTPPLGAYLTRVFRRERTALDPLVGPVERLFYRALRGAEREPQDWKAYARSALVFSTACFVALYLTLRTQGIHPFNPEGFDSGTWDLSFNTAISFVTNTSWQYYGGEATLSYFSQMAGIAVHSFLSAAVGLATAIAVVRGFASRSGAVVGNFWIDLTRALLYVLLPIALVGTFFLVSQGVVQSLSPYLTTTTLASGEQTLAFGPVASQVAIKTMGSVGGGFFNVNSAMPFENATALSSFVQALLIVLVPAALTSTYGRMVGSRRQGWTIYAVMAVLFLAGTVAVSLAEDGGPNLEGKEQRFGIGGSALYAVSTTTGSSGAVNAAMESLDGLSAAVVMANMMTGELIFGGIGTGLSSMLLTILLAVFLGGLMIGRTPEYLGKKIGTRQMKLVIVGTLAVPLLLLVFTAIAVATDYGRVALTATGSEGFSQSLYAYVSQGMNNGSAFAGYTGYVQPNAPGNVGAFGITFADLLGGLAMLAGRYVPMVAALAVAGSLAGQRVHVSGPGTLRSDTPTFALLLIGVIAMTALLNFIPGLMLGTARRRASLVAPDGLELACLRPAHRLELAGLHLALDLVLDLALAERGDLAGLHLAAQFALAEALELEDLQHDHEVDARRQRHQRERADHDGPTGVERAVVVGVGHEAHREGERGQGQRPAVQVQHRAPLREADVRESVVEVPAVRGVHGPAVLDPLRHDEGGIERGHGEDQEREEQRDDGGGLQHSLDRHAGEQ